MATPPTLVQIAFAAGVDESQQGEVLDPTTGFPVLQNVRQDARGAVSKRLGFGALPTLRFDGTSRTAGNRIVPHRATIGVIDGTQMDVYSPALDAWTTHGRVPEASADVRTIWQPGRQFWVSDLVEVNGYHVVAYWTSEGGLGTTGYGFAAVLDATTGSFVTATTPSLLEAVGLTTVLLASYGVYAVAFAMNDLTNEIAAYYLDTTSRATIAAGWVSIGLIATDYQLLAATESLSNRVAIAYINNAGGTSRATVKTLSIAGVLETASINTSSITPAAVDVAGSIADTLWVTWNEGQACKLRGLSGGALATVLATTATIMTAGGSSAVERVYVCPQSTAGRGACAANASGRLLSRRFQTTTGAAATDGPQGTTFGASFRGRPFFKGSRFYAPASGPLSDTLVLVDWTPDLDPADPGIGFGLSLFAFLRPVAAPTERGLFVGVIQERARTVLTNDRAFFAYGAKASAVANAAAVVAFDFADPTRWMSTQHGGSTYLAGGLLTCFDGSSVFESAFLSVPAILSTAQVNTGVTTTLGGWRYVAVYEAMDANGQWHVSGVSLPSDTTGNFANKSIRVVVPPLAITARMSRVATSSSSIRVALYRTLDGGAPPYYRVADVQSLPGALVSYDDAIPDGSIAVASLLYGTGNLPGTNGAAQDRRHCPSPKHIVSCNGVLVAATESTVRCSSQFVSGEGLWFSPVLQVDVPGDDDITALAELDGTVFAFKRREIYTLSVEAPSDNAASGGLGTPRRLAADVGCVDANSVLSTSAGIFFRSDRGIELLSRSGAVSWIGERIQATLASYPYVTSVTLDTRAGLVRISLATGTNGGRVIGTGRDVVYDLARGAWQSVDVKTGATPSQASQDAAMVYLDGWRYGWLGVDGIMRTEWNADDDEAYLDGATWITMAAETAWFKLGGIQGHHHVNKALLLARQSTRADLLTDVSYDYASTPASAIVRADAGINALSVALDRVQVEHQMHDEAEGQSVKLRFQDATPTSAIVGRGKGATWIAITIEGVPRAGAAPVSEGGM